MLWRWAVRPVAMTFLAGSLSMMFLGDHYAGSPHQVELAPAGFIPRVHLLSFGAGPFAPAANRMKADGFASKFFDEVHVFTELPDYLLNDTRWARHVRQARGSGYWFWKAALARKVFESSMNMGDVLVYMDSGCELGNMRAWGPILKNLCGHDIVAFGLTGLEATWTKGDLFKRFHQGFDDTPYGLNHVAATYFVMRKSPATEKFLQIWELLDSDFHLISDDGSNAPNHSTFTEHRHDQSIFSLLVKSSSPTFDPALFKAISVQSASTVWPLHGEFGVAGLRPFVMWDIGYPPDPERYPFAASRSRNGASSSKLRTCGEHFTCRQAIKSLSLCSQKQEPAATVLHLGPVEAPGRGCRALPLQPSGFPDMAAVVRGTRHAAAAVSPWVTEADHNNETLHGGTGYGLPLPLHSTVNLPMGAEPAEVDILAFVGAALGGRRLRYLELGVAIGKTFFMGLDAFPGNTLAVGFTFEVINPTFRHAVETRMHGAAEEALPSWSERNFSQFEALVARMETRKPGKIWGTWPPAHVKGFLPFSATRFHINETTCGAKTMYYIHGDEFDTVAWGKLEAIMKQEQTTFNLIFADAYKELAASMFECDNLIDRGLIDFQGSWAYFWDDGLKNQYCDERLKQAAGQDLSHGTIHANGWLGGHEIRHPFGIVTNMDTTTLRAALAQNGIKCDIVLASGYLEKCAP